MKRNDERRKWLPFFVVLLTLMTVAIVLFFYTCQTTVKVETPAQFPVITETTTTTTTTETTTTTTTTMTTTTTTTTVSVDYTMHIDMTSVKQHKASSPKLVGWIYIPDTVIDYPIMQAEDNNYFLHLDWMEQESFAGCIYEDYRGNIDKTTMTLLYGHNMVRCSATSSISKTRLGARATRILKLPLPRSGICMKCSLPMCCMGNPEQNLLTGDRIRA